jgi:hypothetical protein
MTVTLPGPEAKALVVEIGKEVMRAIALAETFAGANSKETIAKISAMGAARTFNVVRDRVHKDLCLVLTKLFDRDPQSLSFERAFKRIKSDVAVDSSALAKAADAYEATKSAAFRSELSSLRNRVIAHTDLSGKGHEAKYGDELKLLQAVIAINELLHEAFATQFHTDSVRAVWRSEASIFWASET